MEFNQKNICVLVQELKESYINQKLSTESKEVIDLHLKDCKECRDKYDCEAVAKAKTPQNEKYSAYDRDSCFCFYRLSIMLFQRIFSWWNGTHHKSRGECFCI